MIVLPLSSSSQGQMSRWDSVMKRQTDQYVLGWWRESAFRLGREQAVGCRVEDGCEISARAERWDEQNNLLPAPRSSLVTSVQLEPPARRERPGYHQLALN